MKNIYLQFLILAGKLSVDKKILGIDVIAKRLLDEITVHHVLKSSMFISQAMAQIQIASPATIHRKLEELKARELIDFEFRNNDLRTKYCVPTSTTLEYYEKLSEVQHLVIHGIPQSVS